MNTLTREQFPRAARAALVIIILCSLLVANPAKPAAADSNIIIVGPGGFPDIMPAIRNALPNTVIYVKSGTYYAPVNLSEMGQFTGMGTGNLAIIAIDGPGTVKLAGSGRKISNLDYYGNPGVFSGGLWLEGLVLESEDNSAIELQDTNGSLLGGFTGLLMTNCTVGKAGSTWSSTSDAVKIQLMSGSSTIALYNSTLSNFVHDGLNVNVSGTAQTNVLVEGGKLITTMNGYQPDKGVVLNATASSGAHLTVNNSIINGMLSSAVSANADSATPIDLTVHISATKMESVARTAGTNAVEVKAKGGGAHTVAARIMNNTITIPINSDGIDLEPASGASFTGVMKANEITASLGAVTSAGKGITIDNGSTGTAAVAGYFKLDGNIIKGTASSGIDLRMRAANGPIWYGALTNNNLSNVNTANPSSNEGMLFRVSNTGGAAPNFRLLVTNNYIPLNRHIKLDNTGGNAETCKIVGSGADAYSIITRDNSSIIPTMIGSFGTTEIFVSAVENQRPVAIPDMFVTSNSSRRPFNLLTNDNDNNGIYLAYVNPIGVNGSVFSINNGETPGDPWDDLVDFYPGNTTLHSVDFTYYVMQDELGWASLSTITTLIGGDPLFLPSIQRR